jgi:peptidoglycan pentaglycine glycine transferase (the first glycine)
MSQPDSPSALESVADPAAWDRFVAESQKPHIFQSWAWGEIKAGMGWRPYRLALKRDGQWRAGLSVLERDFPVIGRRFFYASRGPVVSAGWTPEDLRALFSHVEQLARSRRAVFLKLDPDVSQDSDWLSSYLAQAKFAAAPEAGGFSGIQPRCVFRLDIAPSEDDLLKAMDQKTRYNIRLAEKKGVVIRPVQEQSDLDTFYRILVETARRDGFLIRPLRYFADIAEHLGSRGQARYFLAEADGRAIAGALLLTIGPVAWYAYGASANQDRHLMPNHLMQWTLIRWAKDHGCRLYDFRAVPCDISSEHPLYGLFRFKKGFGGTLTKFIGEFDRVYNPWIYRAWTRGWPLFKKIRKTLLMRKTREPAPVD